MIYPICFRVPIEMIRQPRSSAGRDQHCSLFCVPLLESWSHCHLISAVRFFLIFSFSILLRSSSLSLVTVSRTLPSSPGQLWSWSEIRSDRLFAISGILPGSIIAEHVHFTIPTEYGLHVLGDQRSTQKTPKPCLLVRKQSTVAL